MISARPDFLFAANSQGTILFASKACSRLAGVNAQTLEGEAFETILDMQDRPNFRRFFEGRDPVGENPFSKVGPLNLRLAKNSEMSSNPIRSVALRVGSINLLPDASSQEPLFFSV